MTGVKAKRQLSPVPDSTQIPRTYREAMEDPFKHHWESAMRPQLDKLQERKAYELVPYPKDDSPILPGK
jgi:hypothetical protein